MKKYMVMSLLLTFSAAVIGMESWQSNKRQIKKMELVRHIFGKQRNTVEMSLESNSQADDEMSCSGSSNSGSFPIPIPKEIVQEKLSNSSRSKHGRTPRQRESSKNLLYELEKQERDKRNFLMFEIFLMHFE